MKLRQMLWVFLPPLLLFSTVTLLWTKWGHGWATAYAHSYLEKLNNEQKDLVHIDIKDIDISLVKLQITATEVTVNLNFDKNSTSPIHAEEIKLQIDPFNLVIGRPTASYLRLVGAQYHLTAQQFKNYFLTSSGKEPSLDLKPLFNMTEQLPLRSLILNNILISADIPPQVANGTLENIKLHINNLRVNNRSDSLNITSDNNTFSITNHKKVSLDTNVSVDTEFSQNELFHLAVDLNRNKTSIELNATSSDIKTLFTKPQSQLSVKGLIFFEDIVDYLRVSKSDPNRIPRIHGEMAINLSLKTQDKHRNQGQLKAQYKNFSVDTFKFGDGVAESKIVNNQIVFDQISIDHPAGKVELQKISFQNSPPFNFKSDVRLKNFDLKSLFKSLNMGNVPVHLNANAQATCEGQASDFKANCRGLFRANDIAVYSDVAEKQNLVKLSHINANVDGVFTTKAFSFQSDLSIEDSRFQANGEVKFKEGFRIEASSDYFDLSEIDNLAHLNLKGILRGQLTTQGDSDEGEIQAHLRAADFSIDSFYLDQIDTQFSYNDGHITLNDLTGQMKHGSLYNGQMVIDLEDSQVKGEYDISKLSLEDISLLLDKKWQMVFPAKGIGRGHVKFDGPLDFWKLNLTANLTAKNGSFYQESFTEFSALIESDGSKMNFNNVRLYKPKGFIQISNFIDTSKPEPELNLLIKSEGTRIEDVDHIAQFYPTLSGPLNITGQVLGPIDQIKLLNTFTLPLTRLNGRSYPYSQLHTELNKNVFIAHGQLFNEKLKITSLQLPFKPKHHFKLSGSTHDFNVLLFLPFLSLPLPSNETVTGVESQFNIESLDISDLEQLTGKVLIQSSYLERGDLELKSKEPSQLVFQKGLQSMTPLLLTGKDQNLKIQAFKQNNKNNFQVSGRLYLKLFQFLVPFADNLSGVLEVTSKIGLDANNNFDFQGDGLMYNAVISTKGFPYPIRDISAYFDLTKSKIIFTEISALLNQSELNGQGSVDFVGPKQITAHLEASTDELELEFPEKFVTSGRADILFSGQWLPYTLKINYDISQGLVTKEFTETSSHVQFIVPPSSRLPENHASKEKGALLIDASAKFPRGVTVKNSLMDGVAVGNMRAQGPPEALELFGEITMKAGSQIIFKDKPFDIQRSSVVFNGGRDINPVIDLYATARHYNYDIDLNISGPGKNLAIEATSQPYLAENDIFSLLALGYVSSTADQTLSSETQQTQTGLEVLSAIGNSAEVTKKLQSKLGVNVQLSPSIDSTRNIAVPKVIVSKNLSKKVQTSFSRTLTGDQQNNEVKLQWLFRPDTSVILNYQDQPRNQETNILMNTKQNEGVGGFELEYKKEFN